MNPDETLRRNVIQLRERNGWTISELADRIEVDVTVLSKVEHGKRLVRVPEIVKLAQAFNVSIDDLLGYSSVASGQNEVVNSCDLVSNLPVYYDGREIPENMMEFFRSVAKSYFKMNDVNNTK